MPDGNHSLETLAILLSGGSAPSCRERPTRSIPQNDPLPRAKHLLLISSGRSAKKCDADVAAPTWLAINSIGDGLHSI
jgi:hypothetical protein